MKKYILLFTLCACLVISSAYCGKNARNDCCMNQSFDQEDPKQDTDKETANKKTKKKSSKKKEKKKEEEKEPEDNGLPYIMSVAVYPVDKGEFEDIIAPVYINGKGTGDLYLFPSIAYGINDKWQVYIDAILYQIHWEDEDDFHSEGNGDMDIGTLYSWMYINKSTLSAAFLFNVHLPTADINKHLTDGFIRYEPFLLLAKDFVHRTWRTQLYTQIGFSFVQRVQYPKDIEDLEPAAHSFIWNIGIAARMKNINYSLELDWKTNTWNNGGNDNELYLTPTVYFNLQNCFRIAKTIALGLAVPIGLTEDSFNYAIIGNLLVDIETLISNENNNKSEEESADNEKISKSIHRKLNSHRRFRSHY